MRKSAVCLALLAFTLGLFTSTYCAAAPTLLAVGSLNSTDAGDWTDLSGLIYSLESGVPANSLGGFGSGLAYGSDNNFLALPDRGPNADTYDTGIDNTTSYINRFHTIKAALEENTLPGLPYVVEAEMQSTTLLWNATELKYGSGDSIVGSGAPALNTATKFYFTGRSDGFDASQNSGNVADARFDTEGIRLSNDGESVFISDEYGPYVYQFNRHTGERIHTFTLPSYFYVSNLSSQGANEMAPFNTSGRVANKGMEGLAITPDGTTLVGIMQNSLIQDTDKKLLRIVTIDIATGTTHQYGYRLTDGSGVSEILAINNHEFLVDERDGKGRADGPPSTDAKFKEFFKIDLTGATDISSVNPATASTPAVTKHLWFNLVTLLTNNGFAKENIPAKIEGIVFGKDIKQGKNTIHTLWIANDNDFEQTVRAKDDVTMVANPNQFFVVGFTDADFGSTIAPQQFTFTSLVP